MDEITLGELMDFQALFDSERWKASNSFAKSVKHCSVEKIVDDVRVRCPHVALVVRYVIDKCPTCNKEKKVLPVELCIVHAVIRFIGGKEIGPLQIGMFDAENHEKRKADPKADEAAHDAAADDDDEDGSENEGGESYCARKKCGHTSEFHPAGACEVPNCECNTFLAVLDGKTGRAKVGAK